MTIPRLLTILLLVSMSTTLSGCGDKEYDDYGVKHIVDDPNYRPNEGVAEPQLAQGQILVVRLVYEVDEKADSADEWYKVSLKRDNSKWGDEVMIQGLRRKEKGYNYDDYVFNSKNFNVQLDEAFGYGTDTLDGTYSLIITGSNGYNETYTLHWAEGGWTNMTAARSFYVP